MIIFITTNLTLPGFILQWQLILVQIADVSKLYINVDHVATLRNARGGSFPDPVQAALSAQQNGADGIIMHLREDRRHIKDDDIVRISKKKSIPWILEMAPTEEMKGIAIKYKPFAICIVPEKRKEITTESGFDLIYNREYISKYLSDIAQHGIKISIFLDADVMQIEAALDLPIDIIELHTGDYVLSKSYNIVSQDDKLKNLISSAQLVKNIGFECHAGHGIDYDAVIELSRFKFFDAFNIGHFVISDAINQGLGIVVNKMCNIIAK